MRMLIRIVRVVPIDQQPAPDHREQHRKIDPVHPADGQRWFFDEAKQRKTRRRARLGGCHGDGVTLTLRTLLYGNWFRLFSNRNPGTFIFFKLVHYVYVLKRTSRLKS